MRVPLIVSGPGIKGGSESGTPVSGSDLLPTIMDLAGNKKIALTEVDGGSFASILLIKIMTRLKDLLTVFSFMSPTKMVSL